MSVLIQGMQMPKEPDEMIELAIFGDGKTLKTGESWRSPVDGKCYYGPSEDMNTYSAFTVHPHGRLIDADALVKEVEDIAKGFPSNSIGADRFNLFAEFITTVPTFIPAEGGE